MNIKINYIKTGAKYIIGAAVLATGLSSTAFGVLRIDNDDYYKINDSDDLKEFRQLVNDGQVNAKGKLMNDIVFNEDVFENWIPIGTERHPFQGELISDGEENKKIKGLYSEDEGNDYRGLFGFVGKGGKVRNIELENSYIRGQKFVGGIAGRNEGEITDCITNNNVVIGTWYVGGDVGLNYDRGIIGGECKNSGTVIGEEMVGGNVGANLEGEKSNATITGNCENSGEVTGRNAVGGNVGFNGEIIEGECKNSGKVTGIKSIGGNVGIYLYGQIGGKSENSGKVSGEDEVGGNIGSVCFGVIGGECENSGKITGIKSVGGNVGYNEYGSIDKGRLINTGEVNRENPNEAPKIGAEN